MPRLTNENKMAMYTSAEYRASDRYTILKTIVITPEQMARFDRQRGNVSRDEYLDELMDMAEGKLPY